MRITRNLYAAAFLFVGGGVFALGFLLLLVKLLVLVAWHAAWIIAASGLALMLVGVAVGSLGRGGGDEVQDRVSDV